MVLAFSCLWLDGNEGIEKKMENTMGLYKGFRLKRHGKEDGNYFKG